MAGMCSLRCYSTGKLGSKGLEQLKKKSRPMGPMRVDLYYDTVSPYSWIAFEVLQRYRLPWNLDIHYKPVFMSGLAKAVDSKFLDSLLGHPNRSQYLFQDILRAGEYYKVPIRIPESPFYLLGVVGSLKQQRFLTAVKLRHPAAVASLSRELWYRAWSEDMDVAKEKSLRLVGERAGLNHDDIEECLNAANEEAVKAELKATTAEAVQMGAFGLPFLALHRSRDQVETFFGSDRFEVMAHCFGLRWEGPVPSELPPDVVFKDMAPQPADIESQLLEMGAITINQDILASVSDKNSSHT